jgi:hypothetical protein
MQDDSLAKPRHDEVRNNVCQPTTPIQAIAINAYEARNSSELSFKKGDHFSIYSIHISGCCYAQTGERQGIVPCKYLLILQDLQPKPVANPPEQKPHNSNNIVINNQINFFFPTPLTRAPDKECHKADMCKVKSMTITIRKVQPMTQDKICQECGASSTIRWRKGLNDIKVLCNKCGLRDRRTHLKAEKKAKLTQANFFTPAVTIPTSSPIAYESCQKKPRHSETESIKLPNSKIQIINSISFKLNFSYG